ncbi:MAG: hypothetical protein WCE79_06525 [Xanthobacteraceae bacterium]
MLYKALASPKRSGARRDRDLYYYYAAFAQSFVDEKICELALPREALILDPWCGSGTTLASARRFGHPSFGCDINPVSVVLTKSRFASAEDTDAVVSLLNRAITSIANSTQSKRGPERTLWSLRDELLRGENHAPLDPNYYRSMRPGTALLLAALFFFARQALREARSKNPSWRINGSAPQLTLTQLRESFENLQIALKSLKKSALLDAYEFDVAVLDNEREALAPTPIADAVITSPPYLTRLDYGNSTGLEWLLLNGSPNADLNSWRSGFTGSVLTTRTPTSIHPLPASVGRLLEQIHAHRSKAARTYYFQFFRNYFVGIQNALVNISAACKPGARGLFVIQDSQFKDLDIPLTALLSDILAGRGWSVERIEPFSIPPTFYKINPKRWAGGEYVSSENVIWARWAR